MTRLAWAALLGAGILAVACHQEAGTGLAFEVTPPQAQLLVGETVQLTAIGAPARVVWSSSNSSVAAVVPETGFVTAVGSGVATISALAGGEVATAAVTVLAPPEIGLSAPQVEMDIMDGEADPAPATVGVTNLGDGTLTGLAVAGVEYAQAGEAWLQATLDGSTSPATLTLTATRGALPVGSYMATMRLTADNAVNAPVSLLVTFRIQTPPSIVLSRTLVPLSGIPDSEPSGTVDVTNGGTLPLTGLQATVAYGAGAGLWLDAELSSTAAPATLTLRASTEGLATAQYTATVTVSGQGAPNRTVDVVLTVTPGPAIELATTAATINAYVGQADPPAKQVNVTNAGGGQLTGLTVGAPQYVTGTGGWLTAQLSASTAPTVLSLTAAAAPLAEGTYVATVSVASPVAENSPIELMVTLVKGPPPVMVVSESALAFETFSGWTQMSPRLSGVSNSGGGTIEGLAVAITYDPGATGWLDASFFDDATTAPATLRLEPNTSLADGTYTATVEVSSTTPGVMSRTVDVTYVLYDFAADVVPSFQTASAAWSGVACTSCHGIAPTLSGSAAAVRTALIPNYVTPGSPGASELVCRVEGTCSSGTEMRLLPAQAALVRLWVSSGAPP